jgi:hypothetical protein
MQTGSSETLIGWKFGETTYVPLWDRMEGAWLWTQSDSDENKRKKVHSVEKYWVNALFAVVLLVSTPPPLPQLSRHLPYLSL